MSDDRYYGMTPEELLRALSEAGSITALAAGLGAPRTTLSGVLRRAGLIPTESIAPAPPEGAAALLGPSDVLSAAGYDPDAWELVATTELANGKRNVRVRPRASTIDTGEPPQDSRTFVPPAFRDDSTPLLIVVESDHQLPHNEPVLDALMVEWWRQHQPDLAVFPGDLIELHTLSNHPIPRGGSASLVTCLRAGRNLLDGRLAVSPDTQIEVLPGNHEARLMDYLLRQANPLAELGVLGGPLDLHHLLKLDDFGGRVTLREHPLGWAHTELVLAPGLVVTHAVTPPRAAGQGARAALARVEQSVLVGDCHRQEISSAKGRMAVAIGCMCRRDDTYPAYAARPTWQQGFATVTLWPSGDWHVDLATYRDGVLMWRGERYHA